jgi:hypothetical protein
MLHKVMQGLDTLLLEDGPELGVGIVAFQEVLPVFLAEGLDERVAVLAAISPSLSRCRVRAPSWLSPVAPSGRRT